MLGNLSGLGDIAANKRQFPALIQLILVKGLDDVIKVCVLIYMKLSATKLRTLDCYFSAPVLWAGAKSSLPRTHYLNSAVCWIKHWGVQLPRTSLPLSMLNHILIQ